MFFGLLALLLVSSVSGYTLKLMASGSTFFDNFDFFTGGDPTHGFVNYVNRSYAEQQGYIKTTATSAYIGVDTNRVVPKGARGRDSVRISSKQTFNSGLFLIDAAHMPSGCGTWPAYWLVGPNWPNNGEIDIIEGVNTNTVDTTTLHTSNGCDMSGESTNSFTGKWGTGSDGKPSTNCYVNAPHEYGNEGCGIIGGDYGTVFNSKQGGVYALEWTSNFIRAFYFPRGNIPPDIRSGNPNPGSWGKPYAYFTLGNNCPANHFQNEVIVINLTFCGDWAGNVFASQCPGMGTCNAFVQNNPRKFTEAFWSINSVSVYQ